MSLSIFNTPLGAFPKEAKVMKRGKLKYPRSEDARRWMKVRFSYTLVILRMSCPS